MLQRVVQLLEVKFSRGTLDRDIQPPILVEETQISKESTNIETTATRSILINVASQIEGPQNG